MHTFSTLPAAEGFRMPAEYEPHRGCVMIWPVRPGSWLYGGRDAQPAFAQAARAIAESETVWMLAGPADAGAVQAEFAGDENIHVLTIETDDAWARDVGPTCVVDDHGTVRGVDWQFNAWGGMVDGLYAHWEKDNAAARAICAALGVLREGAGVQPGRKDTCLDAGRADVVHQHGDAGNDFKSGAAEAETAARGKCGHKNTSVSLKKSLQEL